jgi:hypothetical protein
MMSNWPEKVFIQHEGGGTLSSRFSESKINQNDITYLRADLVEQRSRAEYDARCELQAQINDMSNQSANLALPDDLKAELSHIAAIARSYANDEMEKYLGNLTNNNNVKRIQRIIDRVDAAIDRLNGVKS